MDDGTRWVCYLLVADGGRTYIGATVNPERRLRQHNREITGGARATAGRVWERVCYVRGFVDNHAALQFEWRWKYYGRKYDKSGGTPVERRIRSLRRLLGDEKWAGAGLEIIWSPGFGPGPGDQSPTLEIAGNGNICNSNSQQTESTI
jgi:predicted GIY-YIG superfamily endonuclease